MEEGGAWGLPDPCRAEACSDISGSRSELALEVTRLPPGSWQVSMRPRGLGREWPPKVTSWAHTPDCPQSQQAAGQMAARCYQDCGGLQEAKVHRWLRLEPCRPAVSPTPTRCPASPRPATFTLRPSQQAAPLQDLGSLVLESGQRLRRVWLRAARWRGAHRSRVALVTGWAVCWWGQDQPGLQPTLLLRDWAQGGVWSTPRPSPPKATGSQRVNSGTRSGCSDAEGPVPRGPRPQVLLG